MERIGNDIRLALRRFGRAEGVEELVRAWPAAVGEEIARNAWPARVSRDGTLLVATSSSAWAFELTHLEEQVRGRLRAALGKSAPKRLRFAPGRLPEAPAPSAREAEATPARPGPQEREAAAKIASAISDEELRELAARAAAASLASGRSGRSL
jgi:hypothetical protein